MGADRLRLGLFALAAIALLGAALLLRADPAPPDPHRRRPTAAHAAAPQPPSRPATAALHATAHRFLRAFLAYEVGATDSTTRRAIRVTATPNFARELLGRPPAPPPAPLPPAAIARLTLTPIPGQIHGALVSGSARRGDGEEAFSFTAVVLDGCWLISGPGE